MTTLSEFALGAALNSEKVEAVPGVIVLVKELSLKQRLNYVKAIKDDTSKGAVFLLQTAVFDPVTGDELFPPSFKIDKEVSGRVVETLAKKVLEVSGMLVPSVGKL